MSQAATPAVTATATAPAINQAFPDAVRRDLAGGATFRCDALQALVNTGSQSFHSTRELVSEPP